MAAQQKRSSRTSFNSRQVADELRNAGCLQDVFQSSYAEYNLPNAINRLSGNTRGSIPKRGAGTGASGVPTPSMRSGLTGPKAKYGSSIPRPAAGSTSIGRRTMNNTRAEFQPNRSSAIQLNKTVAGSALSSSRRKSRSHEALSFMATPLVTPSARCRSKSPMSTSRRYGSSMDIANLSKSISVTKDKKTIGDMARYVFQCLEKFECSLRPPDWAGLVPPQACNMSANKYLGIVKFVAAFIVGEEYFLDTNSKKTDQDRILEVSKLLQYPSTVSKANLTTPTAQHAWPSCLTFLAWLCCRACCIFEPPLESSSRLSELNDGRMKLAFESFLHLFPLHFRNSLTPEALNEELENFRRNLRETDGIDSTKSMEQLLEEKAEKEAEYEALLKEPNPSKELRNRIAAMKEEAASIQEQIRQAEAECKQYSDHTQLTYKQERARHEIASKENELARLKELLRDQRFNKDEAAAMKAESETLKGQLAAMRHVNDSLRTEAETKKQKFQDSQTEFYEACKNFDIVEKYNEHLRYLRLDEFSIPANPFGPKELEQWMKEVGKTLRKTEDKVNEIMNDVKASADEKEKETRRCNMQTEALNKEIIEVQDQINRVQQYKAFLAQELENNVTAASKKLDDANEKLKQAEEGLGQQERLQKEAQDMLLIEEDNVKFANDAFETVTAKLMEQLNELEEFKNTCRETIVNVAVMAADERYRFYRDHYGIDLYGNQ